MADARTTTQAEPRSRSARRHRRNGHLHSFRWLVTDDVHGSLYGCRCGQVRPGF